MQDGASSFQCQIELRSKYETIPMIDTLRAKQLRLEMIAIKFCAQVRFVNQKLYIKTHNSESRGQEEAGRM